MRIRSSQPPSDDHDQLLPEDAEQTPNDNQDVPPQRKRGRPRKVKDTSSETDIYTKKSKAPEIPIHLRESLNYAKMRDRIFDSMAPRSWNSYLHPVRLAPPDYVVTSSLPTLEEALLPTRTTSSKSKNSGSKSRKSRLPTGNVANGEKNEALLSPNAADTPRNAISLPQIPWIYGRSNGNDDHGEKNEALLKPNATDTPRNANSMSQIPRLYGVEEILKAKLLENSNSGSNMAIAQTQSTNPEVNALTDKQKGKQKVDDTFGNPNPFGEFLFSSRNDKGKAPMLPPFSIREARFSQENEAPRRVDRNNAYDPSFEALGTRVDPSVQDHANTKTLPDSGNAGPRGDNI